MHDLAFEAIITQTNNQPDIRIIPQKNISVGGNISNVCETIQLRTSPSPNQYYNYSAMHKSILLEKSFALAIRISTFSQELSGEMREYTISRQLLKSGTAPGAMIREAQFAESRADFRHKLTIALKEANECLYWLDLLSVMYPAKDQKINALKTKTNEIISILVSSIKTLKRKSSSPPTDHS